MDKLTHPPVAFVILLAVTDKDVVLETLIRGIHPKWYELGCCHFAF
jgi:hypothetical protein